MTDLSSTSVIVLVLTVSTEQGMETLDFRGQFVDQRVLRGGKPYTGGYTHHCS